MNISRRSEDLSDRAHRLEEEAEALRGKLEKNLVALQHRVKRAGPLLGVGALLLVGVVGGALALRASRQARSRVARRRIQHFLKGVSRTAGEPQRLVRSASLRQRAIWAAAAMGASAAARQFARKALVP
jgi:hypothetical protein